jgi:hypothetical protein
MNAACGWTMIRKTSLLRKINPMMRRSSFTKKIIYNSRALQVLANKKRERRNDLEIMNWIPQIALQIQNSDRSPLYDVRNPASRHPVKDERMRSDVSRTMLSVRARPVFRSIELRRGNLRTRRLAKPKRQKARRLVEPDGIEPTTSCLQSTRSPS